MPTVPEYIQSRLEPLMQNKQYDIIVIGSGSGGLSVGLFMAKAGFSTLMISRSDEDIGGDCLNDGCVPSKAFIHVAKIVHSAKQATGFGLQVSGCSRHEKGGGLCVPAAGRHQAT